MKDLVRIVFENIKERHISKIDGLRLIKAITTKHSDRNDASKLHPLIHKNTSSLEEQRFTSVFTGEEFFLENHQVKGNKVLPGVAYLEMARAAVEKAGGLEGQVNSQKIQMENIVWAQPFLVNGRSKEIHIALFLEGDDQIVYEIYGKEGDHAEEIIYSQGKVSPGNDLKEIETLDIEALKKASQKRIMSQTEIYEAFETMGLNYGSSHRAIQDMYVGENQVIAKLSLPKAIEKTKDAYTLHPSLMNGALQASIGLIFSNNDNGTDIKPSLPLALEKVEILDKCTGDMWTVVGYAEGSNRESKIQKIDIALCDEGGTVCVRMKGNGRRYSCFATCRSGRNA